MLQASVGRIKELEPRGLKDGGHVTIACSNCDKPLVDIWIVQPDAPLNWKLKAKCCYCGDESFPVEVAGRFAWDGIASNEPTEDPNDAKMLTKVARMEPLGDIVLFHVNKGDV